MTKRSSYEKELAQLKKLGAEFAADHPALAPMLAGPSADPDVERLLEGVAFQTGLLREKLDDDFPDLIQDMAALLYPHYLRPVPAATIVAFSPKTPLTASRTIPAGTKLASVPVEGTRCLFRTCSAVEIHPLQLVDASFQDAAGEGPSITLSFALDGIAVADWSPASLRLFVAGESRAAAELHSLLCRHLRRIVVTADGGGRRTVLAKECLQPAGFADDEAIIPYPPHAFPGYRLLQEYFTLPQRFLFVDVFGWERWRERGTGSRFSLRFELAPFTIAPPRVVRDSFLLFAAPAVNLFTGDASPVRLDHRVERYLLRPDGLAPHHAQIFSVDRVTGLFTGEKRGERSYLPFERFAKVTTPGPAYHTALARSALHGALEAHICVAYPRGEGLPEEETLSIALTCSNGRIAELLRLGDLREHTDSSPQWATFENVTSVTGGLVPPLGDDLLWRLVSHMLINRAPLLTADNVRSLLCLYLFGDQENDLAVVANRKRIEGIVDFASVPATHRLRGIPIRGHDISIRVNGDHFTGVGDLYLFGSVLDRFLAAYASINTFTRLTVHEVTKGENIQWQPRLGHQVLP